MTPFMGDDRQLRELFAACVDKGRVESRTLIEQFSSYGPVSATGQCVFPVFGEGDALYEAASRKLSSARWA